MKRIYKEIEKKLMVRIDYSKLDSLIEEVSKYKDASAYAEAFIKNYDKYALDIQCVVAMGGNITSAINNIIIADVSEEKQDLQALYKELGIEKEMEIVNKPLEDNALSGKPKTSTNKDETEKVEETTTNDEIDDDVIEDDKSIMKIVNKENKKYMYMKKKKKK